MFESHLRLKMGRVRIKIGPKKNSWDILNCGPGRFYIKRKNLGKFRLFYSS